MQLNQVEKDIIDNLINAIKSHNEFAIHSAFVDFLSNSSNNKDLMVVFAIDSLKELNIFNDAQIDYIENNLSNLSEDEIGGIVPITLAVIKGDLEPADVLSNYEKIIGDSKEESELDKIKNNLKEILLSGNNGEDNKFPLVREICKCYKDSHVKELVGWVFGFINIADKEMLDKVVIRHDDGKVNKKQTLKSILRSINKYAITEKKPFKVNISPLEKLELDIIDVCCDVKNDIVKRKINHSYRVEKVIDIIIERNNLHDRPEEIERLNKYKKEINDLMQTIKKSSLSEIRAYRKKINGAVKFTPAGSGEPDILLYNPRNKKIIVMSVTNDEGLYIEQNQFFRHAFIAMMISRETQKKYSDNIEPSKIKSVIKNLKIKSGSGNGLNFFKLLNLYQSENNSTTILNKGGISNDGMELIRNDMEKYIDFTFFGSSSSGVKEDEDLKEKLLGHLMNSYTLNLMHFGTLSVDIFDAFKFISHSISAKFPNAKNNKNYALSGLNDAMESVIDGSSNSMKVYSEGKCYKKDRSLFFSSLKVLFTMSSVVAKVSSKNNLTKEDFKNKLTNKFLDLGLDVKKINNFLDVILDNNFVDNFEKKLKSIRLAESETSSEMDNLMTVVENNSLHCVLMDKNYSNINEINEDVSHINIKRRT